METLVRETGIDSPSLNSVKSEIDQAKGGSLSLSARILGFQSTMNTISLNSKLISARTNLKIDQYNLSMRNKLAEMVIDTFEDDSGLDLLGSVNYVRDLTGDKGMISSNGSECSVFSNADEIVVCPGYIYLTVIEILGTGSISYSASLDGGATWFGISKELATIVPESQPVSNPVTIKIKAVITGNARLNGWAYGWK